METTIKLIKMVVGILMAILIFVILNAMVTYRVVENQIANNEQLNYLVNADLQDKADAIHTNADGIESGLADGWSQEYIGTAYNYCKMFDSEQAEFFNIKDDCYTIGEYLGEDNSQLWSEN